MDSKNRFRQGSKMNSVKADDIQKLINHLNDSGYSYSTIKKHITQLMLVLRLLMKEKKYLKIPLYEFHFQGKKKFLILYFLMKAKLN